MDEDDEIPDIREQIFHNTVREQIVSSTRRNTDTMLCPHSADNTIFFHFVRQYASMESQRKAKVNNTNRTHTLMSGEGK